MKTPVSARKAQENQLLELIKRIHADDPEFGYRFICDELVKQGLRVSERRVWRICSENQIFSTIARKNKGKPTVVAAPSVEDLLRRQFNVKEVNRVWVVDITEHPTREGKLYLCALKDLCSRVIVGFSSGPRMTSRLALDALHNAMRSRGYPKGVVVHSDHGSQFRSHAFTRAVRSYGASSSMGRVGAAGDNAAMESFFALLQKNVLNRHKWHTRSELSMAITRWIERTYHRKRRQRALGKLTPLEYEAS